MSDPAVLSETDSVFHMICDPRFLVLSGKIQKLLREVFL